MQIDKEILRRFVARSAATVQSRKRIREALGTSPSAAESTHGMVLAANFTLGPSAEKDSSPGLLQQMIDRREELKSGEFLVIRQLGEKIYGFEYFQYAY